MTSGLDRVVHEPARLRILMLLSAVEETDFKFLQSTLGLTNGNLSSHMNRLEKAGYVKILKGFVGKVTQTRYHLTRAGKRALDSYWKQIDEIRSLSVQVSR
ncbi:MAG: transcriptional regulator [Acidobacteriota bacterium]|nr:transcriptional regulator [Acidobacteriota bacterium]